MTYDIEWVEHDGLRIKCAVQRAGAGLPWIVFANSVLTDFSIWEAQADALAGRYNVLRYDQRGHGETSVPDGACTFEQLGGDLLALLDHFSIPSATLVGLSMGVPTVLDVLRNAPERVNSLVLCDGQSATAPGGRDLWQSRIDMARDKGMAVIAADMAERWFSAQFRSEGKHVKALEVAQRVPLEGYAACVGALQNYDYRSVLAQISVPTLIMVGENDGNMPVSMKVLCDGIDGARFEVIADAGHVPCYEQPLAFNEILLDFLSSIPRA